MRKIALNSTVFQDFRTRRFVSDYARRLRVFLTASSGVAGLRKLFAPLTFSRLFLSASMMSMTLPICVGGAFWLVCIGTVSFDSINRFNCSR